MVTVSPAAAKCEVPTCDYPQPCPLRRDRHRRRVLRPVRIASAARARGAGPGARDGRQRRRDMVVQPVSRCALRHREHRVLLQLLRRDPAGVGVDGDDAGPARDRGLPQLRRRPAGPAPRHPVQHQRRLDDLRRGRREWVVETEAGESFTAPFVVAASGILSVPLEPDIPGMDTFAGTSLFTSRWPKEHVDLTGKRVGVIGTGSTGVQLIPVVAKEAGHLTVFQRSPAYTLPWQVRAFEPGELDEMKANYGEIRAAQRAAPDRGGAAERVLGDVRDDGQPAAEDGVARGPAARHRRERRHGRAQLGRRLLRHRVQPDGGQALRRGGGPDREGSRDGGVADAEPSVRVQAADHRPGLLRDVQPRQRHARRPAQGSDSSR